jgi:hypothetical protein
MNVITVKVPEKLQRELSRAAALRGITKSRLVREAVAEYLGRLTSRRKGSASALDLAGDLVGRVRKSPSDLATKRKYLEDFGED